MPEQITDAWSYVPDGPLPVVPKATVDEGWIGNLLRLPLDSPRCALLMQGLLIHLHERLKVLETDLAARSNGTGAGA